MGVFFNEGEKEDQLKVLGPNEYSFTVDYDDIDTVELITLDESAMTKTGATAKRYHYGLWADPELGDFERCCSIKFQEAVCVTTNDGHKYVFNSESAATTTEMVRMFNDLLAHR